MAAMDSLPSSSLRAPRYSVPDKEVIAIEHPYIIENVDRGIESLGGLQRLTSVGSQSIQTGYGPNEESASASYGR